MLSTLAATSGHVQDSSYFLGWEEYEKNPYHESDNPGGIIQMGLAENQLCLDLLVAWIKNNPEPASFIQNGQSVFKDLALFQDYHGLPEFKKAFVTYMSMLRGNKVKFDPAKLVLTAGATSANETIVFCLANPGEALLLPTPYYPGFDRDLKWRTGVEIVPIKCSSSNGYIITKSALEEACNSAQKQGLKVKGILVTNPSNPLGLALSKDEITLLLTFMSSTNIHLISDEIYAGTVFNGPRFTSVMDRKWANNNNLIKRVHIVTSLSKDLGLPGFRIGAIYSNDSIVVSTATKMSSFGLVSTQTQFLLSKILSDVNFMESYLIENQRRLKARHSMLVSGLKQANINCLESDSGLFCWVDLRHLLNAPTLEAELELWKEIVYNVKLNVSPGFSFHSDEYGWFRVCFANMCDETMGLALRRIKNYVGTKNNKDTHLAPKNFPMIRPPLEKGIDK